MDDLRDILMKIIIEDILVLKGWDEMAKTLTKESLKKIIFRQILIKWVDLRLKSFVNTYVQVIKRNFSRQNAEKKKNSQKDKKGDSDISKKADLKKPVASQRAEVSMRKQFP